jgi:glycosyltransferase involved in cell wall biosynthesis
VAVVLLGDGPARPELETLAASLGLGDRVRFVGETVDVAPWLSAMDLFVSPSPEETFGIAVLEALASGLPVVYSRCPALEGLPAATVGNALHTASAVDPVERTLRHALSIPTGDRRAPRVVALYGGEETAKKIDAIYRRCTAPRSRTGEPVPTTRGPRRG